MAEYSLIPGLVENGIDALIIEREILGKCACVAAFLPEYSGATGEMRKYVGHWEHLQLLSGGHL